MAFLYPYLVDKGKGPTPPDVMYFDQWPVRQPSLLFAGLALRKPEYLALWSRLDPDPKVEGLTVIFGLAAAAVGLAPTAWRPASSCP